MRVLASLKIAVWALQRNKMRSVLTTLGIIIGVGAVIAMVGIGNGAKAQVEAQIASLGQNVILIFAGSITSSGLRSGSGSASTLTVDDAAAIAGEVSGVTAISPECRTDTQVAAGNQNWFTRILGESPEYFAIRQWVLAKGTAFTEQDTRSGTKVAVIGQTVAMQLFGSEDPLDQVIRIKSIPFIVVGVLTSKGLSLKGVDEDDVIIVPYTSAIKRLMGKRTGLRSITTQIDERLMISTVEKDIVDLLRQRHRIGPEKEDDFTVSTQEEIADMATATSRIMAALLGAIAGVSLVVGGIGIMNIMLVSVTERTREIGVRMAVGARGRDILLQFLIEAISLSLIGGLIGIVVGLATSKSLSAIAHWPTLTSVSSIVSGFGFSFAVGTFFGYYPAKKAASLDPIEALRYE